MAPDRAKLVARGITKRFEAATVVDGVDLDIEAGQIVGLIGENGAGKSTLLNILSGIVEPDGGTMELDGRPYATWRLWRRRCAWNSASFSGTGADTQPQSLREPAAVA